MPKSSRPSRIRVLRVFGFILSVAVCQGFYCGEKSDPPVLPSATLSKIHLKLEDPALGTPGIYLAWDYPAEAKASYFEIYQAHSRDSLKHVFLTQAAENPHEAVLALSDSSRPFTLYLGVRAVWIEPTGQKQFGASIPIDSITITPSLSILQPAGGVYLEGRSLNMEVQTRSDPGVMIRFYYFEKPKDGWAMKLDSCLPLSPCPNIILGNTFQRGELVLEQYPPQDTVEALFCVVGTESFEESTTGLMQSLGCKRFFRVGR